ncbi:MAG TPA: hypothetical protein VNL71_11410 [Chloroflexota bacterium]|nr:hypothetical protein [Chloroflexota bacterium]
MIFLQGLAFLGGIALVVGTFWSAMRTFVVPRDVNDWLSRSVFIVMRRTFNLVVVRLASYGARDRVLAAYAPATLLCLPLVWVSIVTIGYTGIYWALGAASPRAAFSYSGSSLLTLGFVEPQGFPSTVFVFSEAALGLLLVALLIAYLPTIYNSFSRREVAVTMLEVRAGSPPSAVELLMRYARLKRFDKLNDLWETWETWFAEVEESHTSFSALTFFRSPKPEHSWVTAAGTVLDSASLLLSALDLPSDPQANLCIRAGYITLGRLAAYFRIPIPVKPDPKGPISVGRDEFDEALDQMALGGVPLKADRDAAWKAFVGWRVNYDTALLALAALTLAPEAPWSGDRPAMPIGARLQHPWG